MLQIGWPDVVAEEKDVDCMICIERSIRKTERVLGAFEIVRLQNDSEVHSGISSMFCLSNGVDYPTEEITVTLIEFPEYETHD